MDGNSGRVRVAIACQGGGSHTAFTAGALKRLLADERYEVVALSGTSGGAICAVLAWYAQLVERLGDQNESPEERRLYVPGKDGKEGRNYKRIEVRWIRMSRPLDFASRLDRSPAFFRRMMSYGERQAEDFLELLDPARPTHG